MAFWDKIKRNKYAINELKRRCDELERTVAELTFQYKFDVGEVVSYKPLEDKDPKYLTVAKRVIYQSNDYYTPPYYASYTLINVKEIQVHVLNEDQLTKIK